MHDSEFIKEYLYLYKKSLFSTNIEKEIKELKNLLIQVRSNNNKVIIAGNGGSAAAASHVAVDFTKVNNIRAVNFNEADLITCLANDYGYENWLAKAIEFYSKKGDIVILISSSGQSSNIVQAAHKSKKLNLKLITFTGFDENNPTKQLGDINFWVDSKAYNIVENTHLIWLLAINDLIYGSAEYKP